MNETIFTEQELALAKEDLATFRSAGGHEEGKWMVSALNRTCGTGKGHFRDSVRLRDITLRTMEQMPGVINTAQERLDLLLGLASAGIPEIVVAAFRRGHSVDVMTEQAQRVKDVASQCRLMYANAVRREELEMAAEAGIPDVQIWSARYLARAMPISAGAVYHRVWNDRDWHDLNFPATAQEHFDRSRRLIAIATELGLRSSAMLNLLSYADEAYVSDYAAAMLDAGAFEIALADSSGATGPEAMSQLVEAALSAAPGLEVAVHGHNAFGMAVASSVAGARSGAHTLEVAINGYETGPGGTQAGLATTAMVLEAMYGVPTGVDLSAMRGLYDVAEALTGWETPWSEPMLGSGFLQSASSDEYEEETKYDRLIHGSVIPEVLGAKFVRQVGWSTGPFGVWDKLREIGMEVPKEDVQRIRERCIEAMKAERRVLTDAEIAQIAKSESSA